VKPGDIVVGGINFGCGSSRNGSGPLKTLGVACVLADSLSRIHLRNAVNTGLPTLVAPGISDFVEEGQELSVDIVSGEVTNVTTGETMQAQAWEQGSPPFEILMAGGLDEFMKKKVREAGLVSG
jgi:3-isopropylmalate/(R)-2-methylmalate dehydratase small subunit